LPNGYFAAHDDNQASISIAMLFGCSSAPEYIPAPVPPIVVKIPTYVALPHSATTPCAEPIYAEKDIVTGVDALGAASRWKVTARCNAGKLNAIGEVQPTKR